MRSRIGILGEPMSNGYCNCGGAVLTSGYCANCGTSPPVTMMGTGPVQPYYAPFLTVPDPPLSFRDQCAIALCARVSVSALTNDAKVAAWIFDFADAMDAERQKREREG